MTDSILDGYVECALWSSTDDEQNPLDDTYGADDLAPETLASMQEDIDGFLSLCKEQSLDISALADAQIGHDLWLTQNRHGAGFWDRGLGELGDKLTELAHSFGEVYIYVGDDGKLYV